MNNFNIFKILDVAQIGTGLLIIAWLLMFIAFRKKPRKPRKNSK